MDIDKDDPRVLALAEVVRTIRPEMTHAHAHALAHALARAFAHDYAYARAFACTHTHAHAHAHAHDYVYARDYAPFTDEEKAQIDAAHALLFT
jgi:hypothetical protein